MTQVGTTDDRLSIIFNCISKPREFGECSKKRLDSPSYHSKQILTRKTSPAKWLNACFNSNVVATSIHGEEWARSLSPLNYVRKSPARISRLRMARIIVRCGW